MMVFYEQYCWIIFHIQTVVHMFLLEKLYSTVVALKMGRQLKPVTIEIEIHHPHTIAGIVVVDN